MQTASAVEWALALSCIVSAVSGVQRRAKVRSALHLQCREGQLISVEAATLVSGLHSAGHDGLDTAGRPTAGIGEQRCQRAYSEQDDDFHSLVRRCSGHSSCVGIVSPSNLTMVPCGEQFGHGVDDFLEVSYICIDASEVSDICANVSQTLFRGYIRSSSYPAAQAAKGGRLRCSCILATQNYASIELLLLDVVVDSATSKLEVAPTGGRPVTRLCSATADQIAEPAQPAAAPATGCLNRHHPTSYSRLSVTFTLNPDTEAADFAGQPQDRNRFLLRYSARELGRVTSTCQMLEGSSSVVVLPHGHDDEGSSSTSPIPSDTAGITSATFEDNVTINAEEVLLGEDAGGNLVVVVSAVVPALLLLAALIAIGARLAWIHQRKKHWRMGNISVLPCCCMTPTTRLSFAPFVSRAFDGVVYAMPAASKANTLHAYDEAARTSCRADCDDEQYDTIPGHHQYQDVEYGCRHYETVADGVDARRAFAGGDSAGTSDESAWSASDAAAAAAAPLVATSSSAFLSASRSGASRAPLACSTSQSTLYEALGDGEPLQHGDSCGSVHSLGIDFSDIVAESLKRMSVPLFQSAACASEADSPAVGPSSLLVQCEDYLSPVCLHEGACCTHAAARAATDEEPEATEPRP